MAALDDVNGEDDLSPPVMGRISSSATYDLQPLRMPRWNFLRDRITVAPSFGRCEFLSSFSGQLTTNLSSLNS